MTSIDTILPVNASMTGSSARSTGEDLKKLPGLPTEGKKIPSGEEETQSDSLSIKALEKPIQRLNDFAKSYQRSLKFSVDESSNRMVITVINTETNEVVRQIPSEEVLSLARSLDSEKNAILNVMA